jgi:uncharacterized protein (DUF488 family)
MTDKTVIFTIGHGNRTSNELIGLLKENHIACLVDVRTSPYSRFNPQYNKETLAFFLKENQIDYYFKGKQLGGRPADPSCYKSRKIPEQEIDYLHEVDYPEIMKKDWFLKGVDHLLDLANKQTTAILCSEEDPANCHRHHLITKFLLDNYEGEVEVFHIREAGVVFNARQIHKSVAGDKAEQKPLF